MDYISSKHINPGIIFVVLFTITLVIGVFYRMSFVLTGIFLLAYLILDKKKLRCPECGGFENLDRLSYAKKHVYHCRHCGERINIRG